MSRGGGAEGPTRTGPRVLPHRPAPRAHPDLARRILAEGHAICSRTMTHPLTFARGAPAEIRRQVVDAQSAIVDATGAAPRLFRGPGGAWSPTVLQTAAGNGMVPIDWKAEPRTGPAPAPPISSVACWPPGRATSGSATTVVAIGRRPCRYSGKVLPVLLRRGLTFVVPL